MQITSGRREFLRGLSAAGGALFSTGCWSHEQVAGSGCNQLAGSLIRWIVPFPPGGGFDIYSRLIAPLYAARLGSRIVVENMSGAGGIRGVKALTQADPDGRTLGVIGGPGLLIAALIQEGVPNPAEDLTILARVVRNRRVLATGKDSPFETFKDVLTESEHRSIVFGVDEVGSANLLTIAVIKKLLGINAEYIPGFVGSRSQTMAALRGDIDLFSATFESIWPQVEAGDLRPLLQVSSEPVADHPSLENAAFLCGDEGVAAKRALELGWDVEAIKGDAAELAVLMGSGVLVAGPVGLEEGLKRCLEEGLLATLSSGNLKRAAVQSNRSLDVASGQEAYGELLAAASGARKFLPIVRETMAELRGE